LIDKPPVTTPNIYSDAAMLIYQVPALLICAGAGIGVDSGLPDFRGNHGFWKAYPALEQEGLTFMDVANPQGFEKNANRAWGFYGHRYQLYNQTTPHEGFQILKRWCSLKSTPSFVFTSNVDGHFQKAGFKEAQLLSVMVQSIIFSAQEDLIGLA
jgi:NAD-dependent SIR2 family protein deacetylase